MDVIQLRRGWLARLRTIGFFDFAIWGLVAYAVVESRHGVHDIGDAGLAMLGAACLTWRIVIATEWVRCDADGVAWRSTLFVHSVPWEQVAGIGVGARAMRLPISRHRDLIVQCLQIDVGEGKRVGRPSSRAERQQGR